MSWPIILRPRAESDLRAAVAWYEKQQTGLGMALLDEVTRTFDKLQNHPEQYPHYYRGFRRALTRRFPYKVFFRWENDQVIVFRILHAKQDHRTKMV